MQLRAVTSRCSSARAQVCSICTKALSSFACPDGQAAAYAALQSMSTHITDFKRHSSNRSSNRPMIPLSTFDPGNRKPLGFKCASQSQHRLIRERQGASFTLIHRDNYTTHSPFSVLRATKYE